MTTEEKIEVERRLADDNDGLADEFDIRYIYQALRDWKIWVMCFMTTGIFTPLYSISLFLPTILKELGYSNNSAQLMTVPVYIVACLCTLAGNYASDRARKRGMFVIGFQITAIVGFILLITTGIPHVQYAGTFLAAAGKINPQRLICDLLTNIRQEYIASLQWLSHGMPTTSVVVSNAELVLQCKWVSATWEASLQPLFTKPRMSQGESCHLFSLQSKLMNFLQVH